MRPTAALLALLAATSAGGCGGPDLEPLVRTRTRDGLAISVGLRAPESARSFRLTYVTSDVVTLVVGLFDRSQALPAFGFFYPDGGTVTVENPLSEAAFGQLQGAIGSALPVGGADRSAPRRYLLRTLASPGANPPAVRFKNFPQLGGSSPPRAYNLFAAAFDTAQELIGFHERDLGAQDLETGSVALNLSLDHGVGQLQATATITGSGDYPLSGLSWLLLGVFDAGPRPRLGYVQAGAGNGALTGSEPWFQTLATFLAGQGLADTSDMHRYCIRAYPGPVAGGLNTVTLRNLPPGTAYRPFILALDGSSADVGHLLSASREVAPGATSTTDLGAFVTD